MKKIAKYVFVYFFMTSYLFSQKRPEWVTNPPKSSDYFVGINFCAKDNPDYISQANSKALMDISSQILVTINSESFLNTTQIDNQVKQTFEESIRTNVRREITGYEQVDVWQNKTEYWIYLRLSKKKYYQERREKFESSLNSAELLFRKAIVADSSFDFCQALQLYLQCTKPLEAYMNESFDSELKNRSLLVFNEASTAVEDILTKLRVKALNEEVKLKPNSGYKHGLKSNVFLVRNGKEMPVKNAPLKYEVVKGKMELLSQKTNSNENGSSVNTLVSYSLENNKGSIKISFDLDELLKGVAEESLLSKIYRKKTTSSDYYKIEIQSPTIFFGSEEKNIGQKLQVNTLEPALKDHFLELGFIFVTTDSLADYDVRIISDTRAGGEAYGLNVSYLDVNIVIMDNLTKEQIYSKHFTNIKGVKQDAVAAGNDAYRKVVTVNFKNELFPEINNKFKNRN
ncbi:LPP20 family lipoprotein [Aurantibacillus circumpalustris]|uniref:LPP20 family lipoprotein n=1 Tax=Aurantibacillus circumpalustris TaxID=3036359 RepID=UPI00295BE14C|nr:LPP20 family lipoprotein [Aurantibacillus circumpalustris]